MRSGVEPLQEEIRQAFEGGERKLKRGRKTVLRILRVWVSKHQQEVAASINSDQSTVSRIESGELYVTPDVEWNYVTACGGVQTLRVLIDHLQSLLDRLTNNHDRLRLA